MVLHQIIFPCSSVTVFFYIASSLRNKFSNHLRLTQVQVLAWQELWWTSSPPSLRSCFASSARQSQQLWHMAAACAQPARAVCGEISRLSQQMLLQEREAENPLVCIGLEPWHILFMIDLSPATSSSSWVSGKNISLYNPNSPTITKGKHARCPRWQGPWWHLAISPNFSAWQGS